MKTFSILLSIFGSLNLLGCGEVSVTEVIPLETDTYISSSDSDSHATLEVLRLSKNTSNEERAIVKLPSEKGRDLDQVLEDAFLTWFFLPVEILARMLGCTTEVVSPGNLTSAKLLFDVSTDSEGALGGKLSIGLLTQPWWQAANWERAHPFSAKTGIWATPGGAIDTTTSFSANTLDGTTVGFDITDYFKTLITSNGSTIHYGFLIQSLNATLGQVELHSTQSTSKPRIEAVYSANCGMQGAATYRSTFELDSTGVAKIEKLR